MPRSNAVCSVLTLSLIPSLLHAALDTLRAHLIHLLDDIFLPFADALAESLRVKKETPEVREPEPVLRAAVLRPKVQHLKGKPEDRSTSDLHGTDHSSEPKTPVKQIGLRIRSLQATVETIDEEDEPVPRATVLRPKVPHLEGKSEHHCSNPDSQKTDELSEPKTPVKQICLRNKSLQPTVETIDDEDEDDHYHYHDHTHDHDIFMSPANARAKRTSPEPSDAGSVQRHASRFTRDPLFPTTFDPRLDLLRPRSGFTTITEHTETSLMADEPTTTNFSSPHKHTRFAVADGSLQAGPSAVHRDPTLTSNVTAPSAENGNTITLDTINVQKHRERATGPADHSDTVDWLASLRNNAVGRAAYAAGYQQSAADQVSAQLAPSDVTYTGLYGGPAAISGRQTRFASHRLVSVPIPEEEDQIYGALQQIGERLAVFNENQTGLSAKVAEIEENLTLISVGGQGADPDLRSRLERERRGGPGGDQAALFSRLVASLGDGRARATAEVRAALQDLEPGRLDITQAGPVSEALARFDRASEALRAVLEQSLMLHQLAPGIEQH